MALAKSQIKNKFYQEWHCPKHRYQWPQNWPQICDGDDGILWIWCTVCYVLEVHALLLYFFNVISHRIWLWWHEHQIMNVPRCNLRCPFILITWILLQYLNCSIGANFHLKPLDPASTKKKRFLHRRLLKQFSLAILSWLITIYGNKLRLDN